MKLPELPFATSGLSLLVKKLFTRAKLMAELDKQHREVPLKKTQNGIRMFIDWTLRIAFILSIG